MAAQVLSPTTARSFSTSSKPMKSILKLNRPKPLSPILTHSQPPSPSPFPFSASFVSIYLTPSNSPTSAMKEMNSAMTMKGATSPTIMGEMVQGIPQSPCVYSPPPTAVGMFKGIPKSPHVHFPPSPAIVSTFGVTHSPNTYDRAPISVSPNPLALPSWGDRVYSPTIDGFRLNGAVAAGASDTSEDSDTDTQSPGLFKTLRFGTFGISSPTPAQLGFEFGMEEDPRSPRPPRATTTTTSPPLSKKSKDSIKPVQLIPTRPAPPPPSNAPLPPSETRTRAKPSSIKFATNLALPLRPHSPTTSLAKSLTTYPRSPYPTAPLGSPTSPSLPTPEVPVSPSDAVGRERLLLRHRGNNRRTLSLDDKKLSRKGRRGGGTAYPKSPAPVSGRGIGKGKGGGFVVAPSPLRKAFDYSVDSEDGDDEESEGEEEVLSPVDESCTKTPISISLPLTLLPTNLSQTPSSPHL
ncbi:hypothetical protein NP233_g3268 [Leucocoprinus birnbaumii]|uniref:Uncharacterized protein n=1 Tax=Leucocoprinus birnbaumii TaxID=56174 RepID=A0AAD5W0M5_9AGAR|nr:hypothetical protein NP233_g3268 [Leucocoprinus birnbaumii]